ncbi:hypothetical protein [Halalkalicoccus paucihalophilus]|uniref:hypothetical protein n=1 Tax=Halalkalicoccus paucihalophilus TaxID=1008153 RepID=UPI0012EDB4AD|nr:hypothetical protein [Halalkalicoccus paucihalophilus]
MDGLEWSEPYQLDQRLEATPPDNGLYRIWYENSDAPLAYIGESSAIPSRLYNHEKAFGGKLYLRTQSASISTLLTNAKRSRQTFLARIISLRMSHH